MRGIFKFLIWLLVCLQALLILFIIFSKFFEKDEQVITLDENESLIDIFMPKFEKNVITAELKERMSGKSYVKNDDIKLTDLSYLTVAYYNFEGEKKNGEMIVNSKVADDVLEIFRVLYEERYPIANISLIDDYDGKEYDSVEANNSYGFCYSNVDGTDKLCEHALGYAITINPLQNPEIKNGTTDHTNSLPYVDRNNIEKGMIFSSDLCVRTFVEHGWTWGGNAENKKYHLFEKKIEE